MVISVGANLGFALERPGKEKKCHFILMVLTGNAR
jgi:hypothetical protein